MHVRTVAGGALATGVMAIVAAGPASAERPGIEEAIGPSTRTPPYVLPVAPGVRTSSLLTVGDRVGGYRMAGIPDGLGAYRNDGNRLTVLMNHELNELLRASFAGAGSGGAFVSEWSDRSRVVRGHGWTRPHRPAHAVLGLPRGPLLVVFRHSASMRRSTGSAPTRSPSRDSSTTPTSGIGYAGQLFFPNEENGMVGRSFALTTDGTMAQLPRLGLFSDENAVPARNRTDTTLAFGTEDDAATASCGPTSAPSRRRLAVRPGRPDQRRAVGRRRRRRRRPMRPSAPRTERATPARFAPERGELEPDRRRRQNAEAAAKGLSLDRIEDSNWDPARPNDLLLPDHGGRHGRRRPHGTLRAGRRRPVAAGFDDIERPGARRHADAAARRLRGAVAQQARQHDDRRREATC